MLRLTGLIAASLITARLVIAWTQGGTGVSKYDITLYKSELVPTLFPEFTSFWESHGNGWPANVVDSIKGLQQVRYDRLKAQENCTNLPFCLVNEVFITASDNATLYEALQASNASNSLLQAWSHYVKGVNNILNDFGNGTTPVAGPDDSVTYNVTDPSYTHFVQVITELALYGDAASYIPPFDAFNFALDLLEGNNRQDAVFYFDIWDTLNAKALAKAKTINWDDYNYTALISLGQGPSIYHVPLSETGRLRVRIVADGFLKFNAPFVIVVDGAVHPKSTPYAEGVEMRNQLINQHGFPEENIIVEPYARQTSTGLRNSARNLHYIGAPFDKPALIVCENQCASLVANATFLKNVENEFGYPIGTVERLDYFTSLYYPSTNSLFVDPVDPLNP